MSISETELSGAMAQNVSVSDDELAVDLADGRTIAVPLAWFPRLVNGTLSERANYRFIGNGSGIHWPDLDEDISVESLLAGRRSGEAQKSLRRWLQQRRSTQSPSGPSLPMTNDLITTSETSKDFGYWSTMDWLPEDSRTAVLGADAVIVPWERYRGHTGPIFPVDASELFQYLKGNVPTGTVVEMAVNSDFKELALHADVVNLATILVKYVAAPLLLRLVGEFLKRKLGSRFGNTHVRVSIIVDQSEGDRHKSVQISYDGPATTFEASMKDALSQLRGSNPSAGSPLPDPSDSSAPDDRNV